MGETGPDSTHSSQFASTEEESGVRAQAQSSLCHVKGPGSMIFKEKKMFFSIYSLQVVLDFTGLYSIPPLAPLSAARVGFRRSGWEAVASPLRRVLISSSGAEW